MAFGVREVVQCHRLVGPGQQGWGVQKENKHSWFVENVLCFLGGVGTALGFSFQRAEGLMTKSCWGEMSSSRRAERENLVWEAERVRTSLKQQKHAADGLQKNCSVSSQT